MTSSTQPKKDVESLREIIETSLQDDKAEDISIINLAGKSSIADYMVVATGRSSRHVSTIADRLADRLKQENIPLYSLEGKETGDWVLADFGDIIVHVFKPEIRELYQLERMWNIPAEEETADAIA